VLEDGSAAPGARVSLYHEALVDLGYYKGLKQDYWAWGPSGWVARTETDESGSFRFPKVGPGRYIILSGSQLSAKRHLVEVKLGSETTVQLVTDKLPHTPGEPPPLRETSN
jgi:protocatechuate 3,4-dioxygenase beta subunit